MENQKQVHRLREKYPHVAEQVQFKPIVLKRLLAECGIAQADLGLVLGVTRSHIGHILNRSGRTRFTIPDFKKRVETYLLLNPITQLWLEQRNDPDIWEEDITTVRHKSPRRYQKRVRCNQRYQLAGDRHLKKWRGEMLNPGTMKHFTLFRNPFIDDVQSEKDIYLSDEHLYAKQVMLDAARFGGFVAIIGEVGSGKSVMRRAVVEELKRDGNIMVVYPQTIDKTRLTAGSICDAIILDISTEKPKRNLEAKSRQVQRILMERSKNGQRHILIIEEAHDLNLNTLKYLKRFYELEDGFRKLLGIILIGQLELKRDFLDEQRAHEAREVIRRCQIAELKSLNGDMPKYLALKFERIGKSLEDIFGTGGPASCSEALGALSRRMIVKDRQGKKEISQIYPLTINNLTAKAMNLAAEVGEPKVTAEVVEQI